MKGARPKRALIVAGEASGDAHAGSLVRTLLRRDENWRFSGFGGSAMEQAGVELRVNLVDQSVMGIRKVILAIGSLIDVAALFWQELRDNPPDLVILVDYPGLNLNLARMARRRGIPVVYYIVPQVWAWGPWRVRRIARRADLLLVILPFEEEIYRALHPAVEYVGNPLFEELRQVESNTPKCVDGDIVGLFPGSRSHEVDETLPAMLRMAQAMAIQQPNLKLRVSCHRQKLEKKIEQICANGNLAVEVVLGDSRPLQQEASIALVVSGTVTLEQAFFGTPMVVLYPARPWEIRLFAALSVTPFIALVNLVAGEKIVPEFLFSPGPGEQQATEAALSLLDDKVRRRQHRRLRELRERSFADGGIQNAALAIERFAAGI